MTDSECPICLINITHRDFKLFYKSFFLVFVKTII